jgi:magnesium transporter
MGHVIRGMGYYREGAPVDVAECDSLVGELPGDPTVSSRLRDLVDRALGDPADGAFLWLGLFQPTKAELALVGDLFGLPPLQIEDAGNSRQRAKAEIAKGSAFVIFKVLQYYEATSDVETGQISVFLGPNYVVTVRYGAVGDLRGVRTRLATEHDLLAEGPVSVLYGVLDAVVDGYLTVADEIGRDIEAIEEDVFAPRRKDNAESIYRLKRENLEMRRAITPLVPTAHELVRRTVMEIPESMQPYFHDIGDHLLRVHDQTDSYDNLLLTMLMASTARQDLQQNQDMRKISAWVAIAAVPTMIAGIYGMNFESMPELSWAIGYPMILLLMLTACGLMFRAFKRSGWL